MKPVLDFSILDKDISATTPTSSQKEIRQYKTTSNAQSASQTSPTALQGVQQLKVEISQGINAGADPYSLLLKAIQAIATMTNDRAYYAIHRDVMHGMRMFERDSVNASLQKVVNKQCSDSQPISGDMDTSDEYDRRVKECFGAAYKFLDENKHARTAKDWERIADSLSPYVDPLAVDLAVVVVREIEREYKEEKRLALDHYTQLFIPLTEDDYLEESYPW